MNKRKKINKKKKFNTVDSQSLLTLFRQRSKPLTTSEISRALRLPKRERHALLEALHMLLDKGKIIKSGGAYGLVDRMRLVTGTISVQRAGMGFVAPDDSRRKDVYVAKENLNGAWHGDRVAVAITKESKRRNHEGRVVRVVRRAVQQLTVTVVKTPHKGVTICHPTDPRLDFGVVVYHDDDQNFEKGDALLVTPGGQVDRNLWEGELDQALGKEDCVDVQEAIVKANHAIPTEFPEAVLREADELPDVPDEEDFIGRENLRHIPFVTIDGETARDFDDAIFVEKRGNVWRLWVAIADVSHYVPPRTALDMEARERGNSCYFPSSVEPMFPEKLSNGLCSLNPDVPRLAMVARMEITESGRIRRSSFANAVIESHRRLTYTQVNSALLDKDPEERTKMGELLPMLEEAENLAWVLNRMRQTRGSLEFEIPEPFTVIDSEGHVERIDRYERRFGNQMIEEFMIAANEAVATHLEENDFPCLYRIHPPADEEKLANLLKLLYRMESDPEKRAKLPRELTAEEVPALAAMYAGTDREFVVSRMLLRSMKQAKYSPVNDGHFGLASESYCHFTSPIRRYADLIVHRILKITLTKDHHFLPKEKFLSDVSDHISGRERIAMDAEREIRRRMAVLYMRDQVGEVYTGIISGLTENGFFVEMEEVMTDGMVRLRTMHDDYYGYLKEHEMLVGERTGNQYRLGQTVRVAVENVSLERLEVDLRVVLDDPVE
ncbi:MAG: ribonuclease R [Desulfovibrio sp.]